MSATVETDGNLPILAIDSKNFHCLTSASIVLQLHSAARLFLDAMMIAEIPKLQIVFRRVPNKKTDKNVGSKK